MLRSEIWLDGIGAGRTRDYCVVYAGWYYHQPASQIDQFRRSSQFKRSTGFAEVKGVQPTAPRS